MITHSIVLTDFVVTETGQVNFEYTYDGGEKRCCTFPSVVDHSSQGGGFLNEPDIGGRLLMAFLALRQETPETLRNCIGKTLTIEYEAAAGALAGQHAIAPTPWLVLRLS